MSIDPKAMVSTERIVDLKSTNKQAALDELIDVLATSKLVTDKQELHDKIFEREAAVSTGVGAGMAVPHVKIATIKNFVAAIGRSKGGIPFDSSDGKPVHIIVMIGCNNTQSGDYLKVLAMLVRNLRSPDMQERILKAEGPEQVRELFVGEKGVLA